MMRPRTSKSIRDCIAKQDYGSYEDVKSKPTGSSAKAAKGARHGSSDKCALPVFPSHSARLVFSSPF